MEKGNVTLTLQIPSIFFLTSAAAAKLLQLCPTLCDPIDGSPPGSPVPGILQEEHWSGLPFPSPMHESEKWKWSRSVVSDSYRSHGLQPTRLLSPWDFPGKSTGVGCHCLLLPSAAAAKSLQLCPTLCDPIDSSPSGSPVPGILQARTLEWVTIAFSNAWKWKVKSESEVAQSCPTPSAPMDCSPPGPSVHGIFQARVLEWVAIAFSSPTI